MGGLLRFAGRVVNRALSPLNVSIIPGIAERTWTHPGAPDISHRIVLPNATYSPWVSDSEFLGYYEQVRGHTLVDIYRCYELWQIGAQLAKIEGDVLEVGVWRGGTGCLLGASIQSTGKRIYLADTFSGVVKAGARDTQYSGGEHAD